MVFSFQAKIPSAVKSRVILPFTNGNQIRAGGWIRHHKENWSGRKNRRNNIVIFNKTSLWSRCAAARSKGGTFTSLSTSLPRGVKHLVSCSKFTSLPNLFNYISCLDILLPQNAKQTPVDTNSFFSFEKYPRRETSLTNRFFYKVRSENVPAEFVFLKVYKSFIFFEKWIVAAVSQ